LRILFDTGSSHSFISRQYAVLHELACDLLETPVMVATPLGGSETLFYRVRGFAIQLAGCTFTHDLIVLGFTGFNVILGMDWLSQFFATLDTASRVICFRPPGYAPICFSCRSSGETVLSTFLYSVEIPAKDLNEVPVVREYADVFRDIPGLPPRREVEFRIDLIPGSSPVSKAAYRLAPKQLEEMKKQLTELLSKG
jgi:hypothetical protein